MIAFQVDDMTCGHCVSTITQALKATDKDAKVTIDLGQHLVMVDLAEADTQELSDAIAEAGFSPVPVQVASEKVNAPAVVGRTCCGSCH